MAEKVNKILSKILKELGYKYSSSTASSVYDGYPAPFIFKEEIVEIPTGCSLHYPMAIFDSWNMLRKQNPFIGNDDKFVKEFGDTIDVIVQNQAFLTHYFDPYDIVLNNKIDKMLKILKDSKIDTKLYRDLVDKFI